MKICLSCHSNAVNKSNGLEPVVWAHLSRKYGRHLSASSTGNIWRVNDFDTNDPVQLSNCWNRLSFGRAITP
jgi:hypothetical protein